MNPDQLFSLTNAIAFFSWILLIVFPYKKWVSSLLVGLIITLFCMIYSYLVFQSLQPSDFENFSTLDGLMGMFSSKQAVLAGWVHYLAFDMLAGLYIVNNANKLGINRWILIPSLLFTFMMGPFGLLIYLITRTIYTRKYLHSYM